MVIIPGQLNWSKRRCQDLCWKVHDRTQSFVLSSNTTHELRNRNVSRAAMAVNNTTVTKPGESQHAIGIGAYS